MCLQVPRYSNPGQVQSMSGPMTVTVYFLRGLLELGNSNLLVVGSVSAFASAWMTSDDHCVTCGLNSGGQSVRCG